MTDSRHHHHAHPVLEIDNAVVSYGRVAALQGIDGSIDLNGLGARILDEYTQAPERCHRVGVIAPGLLWSFRS